VSTNPFRRLTEDFYVAPQLQPADFPAARAAGIRTIINNRPDGEAADQLPDAEARALAQANGLDYVFVPVVTGGMRPEVIATFAEAVACHPGPHLAYCRSGTRSCHMWALATAPDRPVAATLELAAAAGYDLSAATPMLEHLADGH
jgi:uncharacterized protein (TIGR01244 family)